MRKNKFNITYSCTMVVFFSTFAVVGIVKNCGPIFTLCWISMAIGNAIWFIDEMTDGGNRKTSLWATLFIVRFVFLLAGLVLMIIYATSKAAH